MKNSNNTNLLLLHLAVQIDYQFDRFLEPAGLSFAQHKILLAVKSGNGDQLKNIADGLGQTKATVSQQILNMQKRGLIKVQVNTKDHRRHITSLAPKGVESLNAGTKILNKCNDSLFANLTNKHKQSLMDSLGKIHKVACKAKKCDTIFNT